MKGSLTRMDDVRLLLGREAQDGMRVPGLIYADKYIESMLEEENALLQVANVACLPGIIGYSFAMPDIHWGYGFPIGGVAAFDVDEGIISPGGVGYDISCGVRLLSSSLVVTDVTNVMDQLLPALFSAVPCGVGSSSRQKLSDRDLEKVLTDGARWAVKAGYGIESDLDHTEENGCLEGALPSVVSNRAKERGRTQLGTLGSGNHFLEIQVVDEVFDEREASKLGLKTGCITVMIHCGSRGLGHQVCDDYLKVMRRAMERYHIIVPDRQLCCAPIKSEEGGKYLGAMKAAANFALANRHMIADAVRHVFTAFFPKVPLRTVYDVSHNMAHIEIHEWEGHRKELCVHRKGATRAFQGQPVLIPGSMGTASYVLVGTRQAEIETFASTCHGAGRVLSRNEAVKRARGQDLFKILSEQGISVMAESPRTLGEEMPEAYKDVSNVVDVVQEAGISLKVARLRPLAVMKG
ncbi:MULTISPECIES: RtcB family protein [Aminobacterium]|uniref:RtcB family protein n=2 Tax=Aminobacteriaceae TaxID=3029087 RepID=UPI00257AC123|nr:MULTISPECIES: RtcB family protein [unclassified Aminobacterium]